MLTGARLAVLGPNWGLRAGLGVRVGLNGSSARTRFVPSLKRLYLSKADALIARLEMPAEASAHYGAPPTVWVVIQAVNSTAASPPGDLGSVGSFLTPAGRAVRWIACSTGEGVWS